MVWVTGNDCVDSEVTVTEYVEVKILGLTRLVTVEILDKVSVFDLLLTFVST